MPVAALLMDFLRRKWSSFHDRSDFHALLTRSLLFVQRIIDHKCQHRISNHVGFQRPAKGVPDVGNGKSDTKNEKLEAKLDTGHNANESTQSLSATNPPTATTKATNPPTTTAKAVGVDSSPPLATVYPAAVAALKLGLLIVNLTCHHGDDGNERGAVGNGEHSNNDNDHADYDADAADKECEGEDRGKGGVQVAMPQQSSLERDVHCLMQYVIEIRSIHFYLRRAGHQGPVSASSHSVGFSHKHERRLLSSKRFALPMSCDQAPKMSFDWQKSAWDAVSLDLAYTQAPSSPSTTAPSASPLSPSASPLPPLTENGGGSDDSEELADEAQLLANETIVR